MKKGKEWMGILMGGIAIAAIAIALIVFIVTKIQDFKEKQAEELIESTE